MASVAVLRMKLLKSIPRYAHSFLTICIKAGLNRIDRMTVFFRSLFNIKLPRSSAPQPPVPSRSLMTPLIFPYNVISFLAAAALTVWLFIESEWVHNKLLSLKNRYENKPR
jgi:hypothetical protein